MFGETGAERGILSAIGRTPLVRLSRIYRDARFDLYGKLEGSNPCGSIKDRTAQWLIASALRDGLITGRSTVIESSSGNLAIGLAQMCLYHGLRFICVVDPKITTHNLRILRTYGAEIDMVSEPDPETGELLQARLKRVRALCDRIPDSFWTNQYANPENARAHWITMNEITEQLGKPPDQLLCATGSCGTLRGCAEYLRHIGAKTEIIAVDAEGSAIFGQARKKRLIPGHGSAIVPGLFSNDLAARCIHVTDAESVIGCRRLLQSEAILAGGSSGAIISALGRIRHDIPAGSSCVAILSDRGDRYLDTIFSDEWVLQNFEEDLLIKEKSAAPSLVTSC